MTQSAFIGVGSNQGRPLVHVKAALRDLQKLQVTRVIACSSLYRSAPLGNADQPDFVNAVARLDTGLGPAQLLAGLHRIEAQHGRDRPFMNAPRTLDLDLLLFGPEMMSTPALTLPHPRMHERAFVLRPLLEIDPDATVPGRGRADALLASCAGQIVDRIS